MVATETPAGLLVSPGPSRKGQRPISLPTAPATQFIHVLTVGPVAGGATHVAFVAGGTRARGEIARRRLRMVCDPWYKAERSYLGDSGVTVGEHASSPRFVIVGSGRSGTTLLRALLNSTEEIFVPHESDFIARSFRRFGSQREFSNLDLAVAACLFTHTAQSRGWGLSPDGTYSHLVTTGPRSLGDLFSEIVAYYGRVNGVVTDSWALKAPVLVFNLPTVRSVYPRTTIVHVVRDGRDVYLSYREVHRRGGQPFGPKGVLSAALYWVDAVTRVKDAGPATGIACIRYEDLVTQPQRVIDYLSRSVGMAFGRIDPETYGRRQIGDKYLLPEHANGVHAKVLGGVDANNHAKWRSKMPRAHVWLFELVAAPQLRRYHYDLRHRYLLWWPFELVRHLLRAAARAFNISRFRFRESRQYRVALKEATDLLQGTRERRVRSTSK